ncbi:MAG: signal recognition particle-docking protein FtsY [Ruminococcaceae bacterium]|nr:signal recognition particle-docking protein FtsY [Oscillospiraceae bacterium]
MDKLFGKKKKEREAEDQQIAEEQARKEAEAKAAAEAEEQAKAAAEERARREAEEKAAEAAMKAAEAARLAAEQERIASEERARKLAEEAAAKEAAEEARRIAEEKARAVAEEKAKREAEEQAKREAEEQAKREAEEQAKREAEEQAKREAEEQAKREAEEQAKREAEEKAKREAEEQAKREAEEQAKREAEEQAKREAEEQAKREAEEQAKCEDEASEDALVSEESKKKEKKSFWSRVKAGLNKTKNALFGQIDDLLKNFVKVDEDLLEELEEVLICADVGINAAEQIIDELREQIKDGRLKEKEQVMTALHGILEGMIGEGEPLNLSTTPSVILVIGVNGVGKTTSIGKISNQLRRAGKKVVVAAADTFRAAAIDQLAVWCERAKVDLIRQNEGSDPAAVVYDACHAAKNKNADVLIIDTAGRLHNKTNLMNELAKINRVIDRELPGAARENLLVLDATTGQNAISQAKEFKNAAALTGLILNKMDGTAKGGIVLSIRQELNIPVKFIGVGEKLDDMQAFDHKEFVDALFE